MLHWRGRPLGGLCIWDGQSRFLDDLAQWESIGFTAEGRGFDSRDHFKTEVAQRLEQQTFNLQGEGSTPSFLTSFENDYVSLDFRLFGACLACPRTRALVLGRPMAKRDCRGKDALRAGPTGLAGAGPDAIRRIGSRPEARNAGSGTRARSVKAAPKGL